MRIVHPIVDGKKICTKCGQEKPIEEFGKRANKNRPKTNIRSWCKACYSKKHFLKKYGLDEVERQRLIDGQGGVCAICGFPPITRSVVDHDHLTGRVRGILCMSCNLALGLFKDDPTNLKNAIMYLEKAM